MKMSDYFFAGSALAGSAFAGSALAGSAFAGSGAGAAGFVVERIGGTGERRPANHLGASGLVGDADAELDHAGDPDRCGIAGVDNPVVVGIEVRALDKSPVERIGVTVGIQQVGGRVCAGVTTHPNQPTAILAVEFRSYGATAGDRFCEVNLHVGINVERAEVAHGIAVGG